MQMKIFWPWELSKRIDGIAVVCDVWAATTNIVSFFRKGAKRILIVNKDNVQKAKNSYKDALIIGENLQLPKNLFESSNYPTDIEKLDLKNKTILYMSHNGSKIIELAFEKKAKKVIAVSFVNITSVYKYLNSLKENICLIPAGETKHTHQEADENLICIEVLGKMLEGKNVDLNKAQEDAQSYIRTDYADEKFNRNLNFKIVFNLDSSKTIPICSQEKEGWIKVLQLTP